jgi:hypothetical protein
MELTKIGHTVLMTALITSVAGVGSRGVVQSPAATSEPLAKAIVGTWRGEAIIPGFQQMNFGRADLEIRFTDYGTVLVRMANPIPFSNVLSSWVGDYVVVGAAVLISPHSIDGGFPRDLTMTPVTVADDVLEAVVPGGSNSRCAHQQSLHASEVSHYLGWGLRLRRQ